MFVEMNLLASGKLSGKWAQSIANEVSKRIEYYLIDSISVFKTSKQKLLVKTLKMSVICAIAELFIMDSNFSIVLHGMEFFSRLISGISETEPKDISKRDFNTLLVNQSGDGFSWIIHLATNFLRIVLSESSPLLLGEASQLISKIVRLPGGSRSLLHDLAVPILGCYDKDFEITGASSSKLRKEAIDLVIEILLLCPSSEINFCEIVDTIIVPGLCDPKEVVRSAAVDCLAVVVSIQGVTLLDRAESQLSIFSQRNNNSIQEEEEAKKNKDHGQQQDLLLLQILAALRSAVLQRQLPTLDNQFRVVRSTTRKNSSNGMSAMGHTNYEASSSAISERRKPSAGRMHGNLRLPWDPRDSVFVVGYSSGSPSSITPSPTKPINSSMDTDPYAPKPNVQLPWRPNANQVPPFELDGRTTMRRSLKSCADSHCRTNQTRHTKANSPPRKFTESLASLSLASEGSSATRNISAGSPEITSIRRRASQQGILQVNTNLDPPCSFVSDPKNGESPNSNRLHNRHNVGNRSYLNAPHIPLSLTTVRSSITNQHSPKFDDLPNHLKAFTASIEPHSPHLGPLRGQHDIVTNIKLPNSQSDFDIVGRSVHPVGDIKEQSGKQEAIKNFQELSESAPDVSGRTTVLENLSFGNDDFKMEYANTLKTGIEDHSSRSFRQRPSQALRSDSLQSGSAESRIRAEVDDAKFSRTCSQIPTQTAPQMRPKRPPTFPRSNSPNRRGIRKYNANDGGENVVVSQLSKNSSLNLETGTNRDVNAILSRISSSDWEDKVDGLLSLSSLALRNPLAFSTPSESYSAVIHSVISECKNLRSQVSRQAVKTLSDLFRGLGRLLDPHVDTCIRVLLGKIGEASAAFLRGEVAIALSDIIRSVNPNRALIALFQHGPGYYGRRILATLQQNPDFDRIVSRYLSGQTLRAVRDATEYLHTKGLGEPPTSVVSARCPRTAIASDQISHSLIQSRGCSAGGLGGGL
ncbi:unnamed protein product [Rodentolepis nana]|uniref:TOG domain-containing protein n=1 Tax=Rodentolepis nana TaxID=102285 RepID=A0A0R3TKJ9_RODNA|nr:unnamed protein product [Rodentolepis nana]